MTSVKQRLTKKCHSDPRVTVDAIHNEHIKNLSEEKINDYYLDNGLLLDKYYGSDNLSSNLTTDQSHDKNKMSKCHILQYFPTDHKIVENNSMDNVQQYIENIDDTTLDTNKLTVQMDKCPLCNSKMNIKYSKSDIICFQCGYSENIIIHSEKSSYKEPPREASYFAYKRINHFNEWLAQFQAKETTEISECVYKSIYDEIRKNKTINISEISYKQVREILKKLQLNKYYEHIPHIINSMNGRKAPILKRYEEEKLRGLFKEIQLPFTNNCPHDRKNFLSYSYVLHKFCQLLEYDELLEFFPLLKSREKLQQQDLIWKLICKDLEWEYIPSA
jgi:hypothetical protein